MTAPNLRRVGSAMSRNRVTLTTPALLLVKAATVPAMQAAIGFVKELDSRQPLRILLAIKAGHNQSQRKSVTLWKRFAVHLVSDKGGRLHRFLETKCFVVAVGGTEQHCRHVRFRLHLLKQVWQRHAFPDRVRAKAAAASVRDAKQRRFLLDRGHSSNFRKRPHTRILHLADDVKPPRVTRDIGVDKIFGNLIELVARRDLLHLWPSVLCAVVPKGADRKKSPQYAAEEHRCGCSNSKSKKTAQANRGTRNRLVLPRDGTKPWPIQQVVEEHDSQSAYAERDQHFQRCD